MQLHEGQLTNQYKSFITSQGMPGIAGGAALLPWTAFPCTIQLAGYKCTQQTGPAKLIKTPPSTCSTFSTCLHFLVMVIVYLLYLASESP